MRQLFAKVMFPRCRSAIDRSKDCAGNVSRRPTLEKIAHDGSIGRGRFKKLFNMFYAHGAGNGGFLGLPFDHRVEDRSIK